MRNLCIFISVLLMNFAVHANTTKKATLDDLLIEVYDETGPIPVAGYDLKAQLQHYLPTCPLEEDVAETDSASATEGSPLFETLSCCDKLSEPVLLKSALLETLSCDKIIDRAKASSVSRFKMNNLIVALGEQGQIDEVRQEELLASLEEIYEPESAQKAKEREQLINHFQNCDEDYNMIESVINSINPWSDAFGCKGVIETAKEAKITYSEVHDAIYTWATTSSDKEAEIEDVAPPKSKQIRQRTRKP